METEFNSGATMISTEGGEGSEEGLENETQEGIEGEEGTQQTTKKKYNFKVNGKEIALDLDEKGVHERIQRGLGAEKRLEEAAKAEARAKKAIHDAEMKARELQQRIDNITNNPRALKDLGVNLRKLSEEVLSEELELEAMDPRDRAIRELRNKLAAQEKAEAERTEKAKQDAKKAETDRLTQTFKDRFAKTVNTSLQNSKLPSNPRTVARMASYLQGQFRLAKEDPSAKIDLTPDAIGKAVLGDLRSDFTHVFADADIATVIEILGEDVLAKIRKYEVDKLSGNGNPTSLKQPTKPGTKGAPASPQKSFKKLAKSYEERNFEKYGTYYPHLKG